MLKDSVCVKVGISIHALVKRATDVINMPKYKYVISIHALVKRATPYSLARYASSIDFNPRPREEGDFTLPLDMTAKRQFQSTPS